MNPISLDVRYVRHIFSAVSGRALEAYRADDLPGASGRALDGRRLALRFTLSGHC